MKKTDIISLCALAMLYIMAGCSKVEHIPSPSPNPSEGDEWLYDVTLPVPILFGGGEMLTKSPIVSLEDLEEKNLGIFAVDKDAKEWNTTDGSIYINNEQLHYNPETESMAFGRTPQTSKILYYPVLSEMNLDFYAYHPKDGTTIDVQPDAVMAKVKLGRNDILWGSAVAQDKYWYGKLFRGYNAEYIRQFPSAEYRPNLEFSHPASALRFRIAKTESARDMELNSTILTLSGMALTADLCLAANGSNVEVEPGTLVDDGSPLSNLNLKAEMTLTTEKELLCHVFMLPDSNRKIIEGIIVINNRRIPLRIDLDELGAVVKGFQPGYAYNMLLTVDENLNVTVSADIGQPPLTDKDVSGEAESEDFEDGFKFEV